jgi:hypothetical protein
VINRSHAVQPSVTRRAPAGTREVGRDADAAGTGAASLRVFGDEEAAARSGSYRPPPGYQSLSRGTAQRHEDGLEDTARLVSVNPECLPRPEEMFCLAQKRGQYAGWGAPSFPHGGARPPTPCRTRGHLPGLDDRLEVAFGAAASAPAPGRLDVTPQHRRNMIAGNPQNSWLRRRYCISCAPFGGARGHPGGATPRFAEVAPTTFGAPEG